MIEAGNMNPGYKFEISTHHEVSKVRETHLYEYSGALGEIFDTKSAYIPRIDFIGLGINE